VLPLTSRFVVRVQCAAIVFALLATARDAAAAPASVSVVGSDDMVLTREASHAALDDVIVLSAAPGDDVFVMLVVSDAVSEARDAPPVSLRLLDSTEPFDSLQAEDGRTLTVRVPHDGKRGIRIAGSGFTVPGTYRATLRVLPVLEPAFDAGTDSAIDAGTAADAAVGGIAAAPAAVLRPPSVYGIRIKVTPPVWPVGLRTTDWFVTHDLYPWRTDTGFSTCIPTDFDGRHEPLPRVSLSAPSTPLADSLRLPPGSVAARWGQCGCGDQLALSVGPLPTGRYDDVIDIAGEKLHAQLTVRVAPLIVVLWVLLCAIASRVVRSIARSATESARIVSAIAKERREERSFALAFDARRVDNLLQMASGNNAAFLRESARGFLKKVADVKPTKDGDFAFVTAQILAANVPEKLRQQLQLDAIHVKRLSAEEDGPTVNNLIDLLKRDADQKFVSRVTAWLRQERDALRQLRRRTAGELAALDVEARGRVETALKELERILVDAHTVWTTRASEARMQDIVLQLKVAERVEAASVAIVEEVRKGSDAVKDPDSRTTKALFLDLPTAPFTEPFVDVPLVALVVQKDGERLQQPIKALEQVTFEAAGVPADRLRLLRFEWTLPDGSTALGGPRLTHVFDRPTPGLTKHTVSVRLRPFASTQVIRYTGGPKVEVVPDGKTFTWAERILAADRAERKQSLYAASANFAFLALGAGLVAMVALVVAAEKPLETTGEFLALLLAGVGLDTTTGTSMLRDVFSFFKNAGSTEAKPAP